MKTFERRRPSQGRKVFGVFVAVLVVGASILTSANAQSIRPASERKYISGTTPNAHIAGRGLRLKTVESPQRE
jgi:hypothetical protein